MCQVFYIILKNEFNLFMEKYIYLFLIGFLLNPYFINCQSVHGEVIYAQSNNWSKIASLMPYLNQEEKDRIQLSWGKSGGYTEKMKLLFNDSLSHYTYVRDDKGEESNWSYKKLSYEIYRNYLDQTSFDRMDLLGKIYIVKDKIQKRKWKIVGEIKEVGGYVCMKAETYDTIKNQKIIAWFTDKILVPLGPAEFGGLPGLILEININDNASSIIAETINLDKIVKINSPKTKGKLISHEKYQGIVKTYIQDCIERRRNPFWDLRY